MTVERISGFKLVNVSSHVKYYKVKNKSKTKNITFWPIIQKTILIYQITGVKQKLANVSYFCFL